MNTNQMKTVAAVVLLSLWAGCDKPEMHHSQTAGPAATQPASDVTAILGAFDAEIAMLEGQLQDKAETKVSGLKFTIGTLNGRRVVVAQTGMGKVNAAMTTAVAITHFKPREVLFSGIAGGLNPLLRPGDIVIGEKTYQHDLCLVTPGETKPFEVKNPATGAANPVVFEADRALLAVAKQAAKETVFEKVAAGGVLQKPHVVAGVIATGDMFVASADRSAAIRKVRHADAVEMEGAAVAQVCHQFGTPCIVIRCISDMADATAAKDCAHFYLTAAKNSAALVAKMAAILSMERRGSQ